MAETSSIASVTSRIDSQEIRIYQHDTQEMRKQYEDARRREAEASRMLEVEKQRCRNQEAEIERRRQQLEESSEFIRRLQGELEDARRTASGVRRELRENEIKSILDAEIMHFKTQIIRLEAKLQQKETDLEAVREFWKEHSLQLERKVESLKAELALKEKMYNEIVHELQNSPVSVENNKFKEKVDQLNQRIGSLAAINENLQDKINGMLAEKFELENKVRYANEDKSTLQSQINSLKAQLSNSEGTNQLTNCKLSDEIDKIKHQKAQLRYEHLQLKRNFSQLEKDNKALRDQIEQMKNSMAEAQKSYENLMNEKTAVINEKSDLFNQIASLKDELSIQQKKAEDAERLLRENEICEQAATHQLKAELQKAQDSRKELTEALVALDAESERMLSKLRVVNQEKKNAVQESSRLKKELDELRSEAMTQCRLKNDLDMAREENSRLILRIKYLENELNESRTEHRAELDRLAEKIIAATSTTANAGDCALQGEVSRISLRNLNVDDLQNRLKQQESQNRYWQRSVEQSKKELESVNNEISELRKRQCELINDNTVLRQALAEAVKKGELYRDENAELKKSTDDVDRYQQKIQQLEEELYDVRGEIAQKEKLIAYLQSNQQPKQMRKLKASSFSTLISASNDSTSVSDFELETQECDQLQKKRDWLRQNLEQQRRVLTDKQNRMLTTNGMNEAIPLLKPNTPMPARRVQSPRNVEKPANQQLQKVFHSPAVIINNKAPMSPRIGTMRHDIPHKWKTQFIFISSSQCGVCYEGIPHLGHSKICRQCSLVVHARCLPSIMNTCNLPSGYADYYLGAHATPLGSMNGWVKLWMSDDRAGNKWRNAWAIINKNCLNFYDSDQLAMSNGPPFRSIDLDKDQWRIFNQMGGSTADRSVLSTENAPMIIEIKLKNSSLFMLTPTPQAKQRWVQALHLATNRRLQRSASNVSPCTYSLLMSLESPMNLAIHCTLILDNEWLLIGCEEGLFATNLQIDSLRAPFRIPDVKSIFFMELIAEHDMLLLICDKKRIPSAIHLQQLRRALRAEDTVVQYTPITSIVDCHTAAVSKVEHSYKRYVYLATIDSIHVLQYVEKKGNFSRVKQIKTAEPCICLCSTPFGFIYGADQFHTVTFENEFESLQISIDNCPSDFPLAVVNISTNEYLLAYTNYGVFVTAHGERTRAENVEWSRLPLEFVYTDPHLYIVYCDFLEVVRVANNVGLNSPAFTENRYMFKCRSAHRTGMGRTPSEVLFSVSSEDRVELHAFRTDNEKTRPGTAHREYNSSKENLYRR